MGSRGYELMLDLKPRFHPRTISNFLKQVSTIGDASERVSKLDEFVKELEEEMRKIDAFKRELPLCMLLLNDAISDLKKETKKSLARKNRPVLEEFIPLKKRKREAEEDNEDTEDDEDEEGGSAKWLRDNEMREKMNWVSSFQLWKSDDHSSGHLSQRFSDPIIPNRAKSKRDTDTFPGTIMSSARGMSLMTPAKEEAGSDLGLASGSGLSFPGERGLRSVPEKPPQPQPLSQHQTSRKQRRCWSADLHSRFLNALHQLGGSQVATPKQIRELMQVEGLTNDEVKSHLQKYRLHNRKLQPGNSNSTEALEKESIIVSGTNSESSKGRSSESDSPQGPLQSAAPTATTTTGGDSAEEDEEAKSELHL